MRRERRLVDELRRQLGAVDVAFPDATVKQEWVTKRKDLDLLLLQDEIRVLQQSRQRWLHEGDRNSCFSFGCMKSRSKRNTIHYLLNDLGVAVSSWPGIEYIARFFFVNLFASSNPVANFHLLASVEGRITTSMNEDIGRPYVHEEFIHTLKQMDLCKAPGPDGMNGIFLQTNWEIVGNDFLETVLTF